MTRRTGPTNVHLANLITDLKILANKEKVNLWKRIAKDLEKSTRRRAKVNLYKIERYCKDGEIALVPGKVLSEGETTKKIDVVAYSFSDKAKHKIKGKALTIRQLMKENPKGKKVRIFR
ncbi:MAG: 50S ribosomal protein L18e [Candidatus Nanoarchaeia archaeon]|nr:50S ribosomal protein L18e [Candidatus Nanoarchaeia archaeon]